MIGRGKSSEDVGRSVDDYSAIFEAALQDIISLHRKIHFKGPIKRDKLLPEQVANIADEIARAALAKAGRRVRKTGNV